MKHAILMMAHNNEEVVKAAFHMLDDPRFNIFLLVDKKQNKDPNLFVPELKETTCTILKPIEINWGGYSVIEGILSLVKTAVDYDVDYLHYLQGADLPIKTPDEIDSFFTENSGKNYLMLQPQKNEFARYKVLCRHFFANSPNYRKNKILKGLRYGFALLQKPFMDKEKKYYHASALFSITSDFARYVTEHEKEIENEYRYSLAGDEVFLATMLLTSSYKETLANEKGTHFIDWARNEGNSPKTFTMDDVGLLRDAVKTKDWMFARKFSQIRDMEIVRQVEKMVEKTSETN